VSITKPSDEEDTLFLTCQSIKDEERRIEFQLARMGGGFVEYAPIKMNGFTEKENLPDFIINEIFFEVAHPSCFFFSPLLVLLCSP